MATPKKKKNIAKKKSPKIKTTVNSKSSSPITPFLMFNANLEEVTNFYTGIFKQSKAISVNPM